MSLAFVSTSLRKKGGGEVGLEVQAEVERRLFVWSIYRLLDFNTKLAFLHDSRELPARGHIDARVAHRN